MGKKVVRRRKPTTETSPERAPKKSSAKLPEYREIAWLRDDGDSATCSCGKISVTLEGFDAVIRGQHGWIQEGQWITCGVRVKGTKGCLDRIRFSPRLVWHTNSGARYTTNGFLKEGEQNRRLDDGA